MNTKLGSFIALFLSSVFMGLFFSVKGYGHVGFYVCCVGRDPTSNPLYPAIFLWTNDSRVYLFKQIRRHFMTKTTVLLSLCFARHPCWSPGMWSWFILAKVIIF